MVQKQMCCFLWNCEPSKETTTSLSDSSCIIIFSFTSINIITINFQLFFFILSYIIKHLSTTSLCVISSFLLMCVNDNFSKRFVLSRVYKVEKIIF